MKSFSFGIDSNGATMNAIIQGNLASSQQNWFNLYSTGTAGSASALFTISTPLHAVRGIISSISAGTGHIWYSFTSN